MPQTMTSIAAEIDADDRLSFTRRDRAGNYTGELRRGYQRLRIHRITGDVEPKLFEKALHALLGLASEALNSRSSVFRKIWIDRSDRIASQHFRQSLAIFPGPPGADEMNRPSPDPCLMKSGHHAPGPVSGAGASVPTATICVLRRFPKDWSSLRPTSLRPAVLCHAAGSSQIRSIGQCAPSPSASTA